MNAIFSLVRISGENFKQPEDWTQIIKLVKKKEKKIILKLLTLPDNLQVFNKHRIEIQKLKKQCFGKGKIWLTSIPASFQKESRTFANYFALVVLALKEIKAKQKEEKLANELKQTEISNKTIVHNITPVKIEPNNKDIEFSESWNDTDSVVPKDSADDTSSYFNKSKYTVSSADPTPEQKNIKKSPLSTTKKIGKASPKNHFVKKGYLSSDNQSTGSYKRGKKKEEVKQSPTKRLIATQYKKHPAVTKREVDLKVEKSSRSPIQAKTSRKSKTNFKHSMSEKQPFNVTHAAVDTYKYDTNRSQQTRNNMPAHSMSANENYNEHSPHYTYSEVEHSRLKTQQAQEHYSETTEESEDLYYNKAPKLKVYDKKVHGGLLYAFLELHKWNKPQVHYYSPIQKTISFNAPNQSAENYKKSIADYGMSGISRQHSSNVMSSGSLSDEDYKRIDELKNERRTIALN